MWAQVDPHNPGSLDERLARNASQEVHRRYYLRRYAPLAQIAPDLPELFYRHHKTSAQTMVPYPDTGPVLATLAAAGLAVGIVSNTGWDISAGYARAGLDRYIDTWVLSWEHGTAKPDPRLFHLACGRLGVPPARTVMVGNDPEADGAAVAAGATALILPPVPAGSPRGLDAVLALLGLLEATDAPGPRTGPVQV